MYLVKKSCVANNAKSYRVAKCYTLARYTSMLKQRLANFWRRKRNRYRMVIMNDDTFEEVVTLKLTRLRVYMLLSSIFVLLVAITIGIVSFTSLRFLIPGYGKQGAVPELRSLQMRADSLEQVVELNNRYLQDVKKILQGDFAGKELDTTTLQLPKIESEY